MPLTNKNHILQICPDYWGRKLYHNLFQELERCGEKSIVYVPTAGKKNNADALYKVDFLDKKFNVFERLLYYGKQNAIYNDICKKCHLSDVKMTHAHTLFSSGYTAYRLHKKTGLPYIVAIRNTDVNTFFKYMLHLRKLGVNIMKDAHKIVFLSNTYKEYVVSKYVPQNLRDCILKKSIVIPNGIDQYFLGNKNQVKTHSSSTIKILCVGRKDKNKNIETTVKACLYLQKLGYNVRFTIVGDYQDTNLKNKFSRYPFVLDCPKADKETILSHMRESDVFIMPSITETFGVVYPEAMSQGLPIIYSKGQGFDRYFENGIVGFSVNCFDYKDIANKTLEILANYDTISRNCINNVDMFDWKEIALTYKRLYNE